MRIAVLICVGVLGLAYLSVVIARGSGKGSRAGTQELLEAIDRGDVDAIHRAVSQGADVNGRFGEITPLTRAICNGRGDIVRALIRLGADVNAAGPTGRTPLMTAAMKDDVGVAELLVANGANPGTGTGGRFTRYVEVARKD